MTGEGKKELLRQIPRVKLWLVLALTGAFAVVLLAAAHITHSLTLRVEAYHGLYNLLSLSGCLLTMKLCSGPQSLHNTFGWARLEVLSMMTTLLFLLALCFSVAIESIQTAVHAEHQDAMHHPLSVMALGGVGLCLNALVFALIGGYTHHQGCFLEMRDSGSVWVGRQVTQEAVQAGRRMLSSNDLRAGTARPPRSTQIVSLLRDALGLVLVEICAAVVHWDDGGTVALYIDPALAVTSAVLLMWLSYPFGRECGHILLQTIPGHIDVENFQTRVLQQFPAIVNIHHLHIWSFTPSKVVATAHVVFSNPRVYLATQPALKQFFMDEGITQVTIQPECMTTQSGSSHDPCLLRCQQEKCHERECCPSCSPHPLLSTVTSTHPTTRKRRCSSGVATNGSDCRDEAEEGGQELTEATRAGEGGSLPREEGVVGVVRGKDPELTRMIQVRESGEIRDDVSERRSNESLRDSSGGGGEEDKVEDKVETSDPGEREEETLLGEDSGTLDVVTVDNREVLEASYETYYYHALATCAPEEHHQDNTTTTWGQQHNGSIPNQHHNTNIPCQLRSTNTSQEGITNTIQQGIDSSQRDVNTIQQDLNQQDLSSSQQDINTTSQKDLNTTYTTTKPDLNTTYTTTKQDLNTTYTTSQKDLNTTYTTSQKDLNTTYTITQQDLLTTTQQHSRGQDTADDADEADETIQLLSHAV